MMIRAKDLMAELAKFDGDLPVVIRGCGGSGADDLGMITLAAVVCRESPDWFESRYQLTSGLDPTKGTPTQVLYLGKACG
jgi:hypothetical protein